MKHFKTLGRLAIAGEGGKIFLRIALRIKFEELIETFSPSGQVQEIGNWDIASKWISSRLKNRWEKQGNNSKQTSTLILKTGQSQSLIPSAVGFPNWRNSSRLKICRWINKRSINSVNTLKPIQNRQGLKLKVRINMPAEFQICHRKMKIWFSLLS